MNQLVSLMEKARSSAWYLWLLNFVLLRRVPFNNPHKIRITKIGEDFLEVRLPYRRSNLNHIKGLHACGLATVAEYASGLLLLRYLDPLKFRLIMQSLDIEYHYQGKMDGVVRWKMDTQWLQDNVLTPLTTEDVVQITPEIEVHDSENNLLCTARICWQVKNWSKVRTAVT